MVTNFCSKNPHAKVSLNYHSKLKIKHVVQMGLLRIDHSDAHYCSAFFHYQRELAVKFQEASIIISIDNKHRIKVGEQDILYGCC